MEYKKIQSSTFLLLLFPARGVNRDSPVKKRQEAQRTTCLFLRVIMIESAAKRNFQAENA
jgi:hypothetical protein